MSFFHSPRIVTNRLVLLLDAANRKSYPKTGSFWNDISKTNNNGILVNSPSYTSDNLGGIRFDGTNKYVTIGDSSTTLLGLSDMTLEVTVKLNTLSDQIFVQKFNYTSSRGYGIEISGAYVLAYCNRLSTINPALYPTSNLKIGTVYTFTLTKQGPLQFIYVNGNLIGGPYTTNGNGVADTTGWDFRIGARSNAALSNSSLLNGDVYSVKMYNKALSQSEILQNFGAIQSRFGI